MTLITDDYRDQNRRLLESNVGYGEHSALRAQTIHAMIQATQPAAVLDYGAGKGLLAKALDPIVVREYDPAVPGKDARPEPADFVVCTDVLEHIEPECLDAVLDDLARVTEGFAYIVVSTVPSKKTLPDGRNTHLIQEPMSWWLERIGKRFAYNEPLPQGNEFQIIAAPIGKPLPPIKLFDSSPKADELVSIDVEDAQRLGQRHYLAGDFPRAEECFLAVVRADPKHSFGWSNLGLIWQSTGFWDDAMKCYMRAIECDPANATAYTNMGYLYDIQGHFGHAERCFTKALEIQPGQPRATGNLGQVLLRKLDFARAWPMMEARFTTTPKVSVMREYSFPLWDGRPCRKLAVWPEQGVGDQLLYASLLPELFGRDQDFVCELDARLIPAFQRSFPIAEFVPKGHTDGFFDCDAHIPIMSLGGHFRNTLDSFLGQPKRLLRPDPIREFNFGAEDKKNIAISWRSFQPSINVATQVKKSAPLAVFTPLAERTDLRLITAQYGNVDEEVSALPWPLVKVEGLDLFADIDGVLSMISACDAVVTTSNVTAHFAGALGKECYLLCQKAPPFMYHTPHPTTGRSLWWPSIRVVVEPTWEQAIAKVMGSL